MHTKLSDQKIGQCLLGDICFYEKVECGNYIHYKEERKSLEKLRK